jgi:hypothetical protein
MGAILNNYRLPFALLILILNLSESFQQKMAASKNKYILIVCCLLSVNVLGQTQDSYTYHSEFTWGINKNTYSGLIGGIFLKKARKLNENTLETYGLELINVKNPQEVRRTASSGNLFLYGKSNYLYALRLQYGRDLILFKKAPQQGVEIKAVFAIGPTIGIVAPYYVQVGDGGSTGIPVYRQYDPQEVRYGQIQGTGKLFQGIGQSKITMGGNLKAALNFELGTVKSQVTGFEAGFLLDAYTKKIVMVPTSKNYAIYPTFFIAIFYGSRK